MRLRLAPRSRPRLDGGGQTYFQLTPDQYGDLHTSIARTPEQRLCLAHLTDAFAEASDLSPMKRADRYLARDWIRGIIKGRFSFDLCCEALHLEPEWLRRRLLKRVHDAERPNPLLGKPKRMRRSDSRSCLPP